MVAKVTVVRKKGKYPSKITGPSRVKVGFPSGAVGGDIVSIAIWNHFGTSRGIPSRPFLLNAIRRHKRQYMEALKSGLKGFLSGSSSPYALLTKLGIQAQGDIQMEITNLRTPPNHPDTIRQKGSSNPLIWSGRMRGAVTYKVED